MNYFPVDMSWDALDMRICLPIVLALVFFVIYWFTAQSPKIKARYFAKYDADTASLKHIFFTKAFGFFSMGVVPTIICLMVIPDISLGQYGLTIIPETTLFTLAWTAGLCVLVIPLAFMSAKNPKNFVNYPQIRSKVWTKKTLFLNLLGWAIYLFGYEFLFRGVLLIPLVEPLGVWPAIAINIALYSATHIPKGLDETIGAIPLGIVLCLLTLASGTIWIAFIVHLAMAWTNSLTSLKFNPDINYKG
jgi:membrane protease YdiL (CAAX protease family)